ncbi:MAG: hypothetical protein IKH27_14710 [Oscillospiraceae bacterium]|nr:hypothetical protein [Oscillospiraceae bacterium]
MKTTMKKRLAKGILAAAFAFVTVFSVPQFPLYAEPVTAHASCSHHCRHYRSFGDWKEVENREERSFLTKVTVSTQMQIEYDACSDCGYKKQYATHCRLVSTYYSWSGHAYKTTIRVLC